MSDLQTHIGYSVFDTFEGWYEYDENACMIAATRLGTDTIFENSDIEPQECRIDSVTFGDIMKDYGGSCGLYTMESDAFLRFKRVAEQNGVEFSAKPSDGELEMLIVEIDGVSRRG